MSEREVASHFRFEEPNQSLVHELIVIRDVEADYTDVLQVRFEALLKLVSVRLLHHENDVCPTHKIRG